MRNRPTDTDADFDPVRSLFQESFQQAASSLSAPPVGNVPSRDGRDRLAASHGFTKAGRPVGSDTLRGLANYFVRQCPPLAWDTSLELGNYKALVALMATLKRDLEMTPADIRAFIDYYFISLQGRRPKRAYMWDFKGRYHSLLEGFVRSGVSAQPQDYTGWQSQDVTTAEMQAASDAAKAARARRDSLL